MTIIKIMKKMLINYKYAPSSPPTASAAEWQAFQDDDSRTYYYIEST